MAIFRVRSSRVKILLWLWGGDTGGLQAGEYGQAPLPDGLLPFIGSDSVIWSRWNGL